MTDFSAGRTVRLSVDIPRINVHDSRDATARQAVSEIKVGYPLRSGIRLTPDFPLHAWRGAKMTKPKGEAVRGKAANGNHLFVAESFLNQGIPINRKSKTAQHVTLLVYQQSKGY